MSKRTQSDSNRPVKRRKTVCERLHISIVSEEEIWTEFQTLIKYGSRYACVELSDTLINSNTGYDCFGSSNIPISIDFFDII